jgi:hypothetical protein
MPFFGMALVTHRLGDTGSEPLPQCPDRLTDLRQRGVSLRQRRFDRLEPRIKARMEVLASGLALATCPDVISRDHLCSTSHGEPSQFGKSGHYS